MAAAPHILSASQPQLFALMRLPVGTSAQAGLHDSSSSCTARRHKKQLHFGVSARPQGDPVQFHSEPGGLGVGGDFFCRDIDPPALLLVVTCVSDNREVVFWAAALCVRMRR